MQSLVTSASSSFNFIVDTYSVYICVCIYTCIYIYIAVVTAFCVER
jgi:hypothetical protein